MNRFDPYHIWLGIPPEEQPPNHYRLLGISLFESDRDVIRNAADQRMTYLKTYGGGQHSELSQKLLNEVSAAKVCLLDEAKRREYDDQLRQHAALSMPVETRSIAVSSAQTDTQPTDTPLGPVKRSWGNRQSPRNARRSEMLRTVVAVVVPVVLFAILVVVVFDPINPGGKGETKAPGSSKVNPPPTLSPKPSRAVAPFTAQEAKQFQQAWADYLEVPVERVFDLAGGDKLTVVLIPPGKFLMGSTPAEQAQFLEEAKVVDAHYALEQIPDEDPQHRVQITQPFYLGKCEVTQAQWKAVMDNNPSRFSDLPSHPVEQVSWSDIQLFLSKLNECPNTLAVTFRLPTEAEWEYACRAGATTFWHCGNDPVKLKAYAWLEGSSDAGTHPVGQLLPNQFGVYDMHGNVWEWCQDWYGNNYYRHSPTDNPMGPHSGTGHVLRSGGGHPVYCRSAYRTHGPLGFRRDFVGLRLVAVLMEK